MQFLNKMDHILSIFEKCLVVILFSALVLLIIFNIFSRNLFHVSFQKMLEFSPAIVLWLALTGSSLALRSRRHIKLELLLRFCPEKIRLLALVATSLFGMAVMSVLCIASFEFVKNEVDMFGTAGWIVIIFPLFFSISFFRYFLRIVNKDQNKPSGSALLSSPGNDEVVKP